MRPPVAAYSLLAEEDDLVVKVRLDYFHGTHFSQFQCRYSTGQEAYLIKIYTDTVHSEFLELFNKTWSHLGYLLVKNRLDAPIRPKSERPPNE